jgi:glycosyltransferase involved in cell wall biosynthesis
MMPTIWAITGASLVLLRDEPTFLSVIPSKIFESMAMQRPIILGVRGESQALVEQSGAGICIQPESAAELATAVRRLHADAGARRAMGEAGRRFVAEHFDRKVLAARYLELLAGLAA